MVEQSEVTRLVRGLRQKLELSQEKFAARLGVSVRTVNRWENGRSIPSPMALKLIEDMQHRTRSSLQASSSFPPGVPPQADQTHSYQRE